MASSPGNKGVIELLIANGIEKNPRDMAGMTPLHIAVYNGHKEAVLLLIAKGAKAGLIRLYWPNRAALRVLGRRKRHS